MQIAVEAAWLLTDNDMLIYYLLFINWCLYIVDWFDVDQMGRLRWIDSNNQFVL